MRDYNKFNPSLKITKYTDGINDVNDYNVIFITDKTSKKLLDSSSSFLEQFELVIFDECHHIGPGTEQEYLFDYFVREDKYIFGMTATIRRTKEPLYLLMKFGGKENVVGKVTVDLALKEKIITPMKYYVANSLDDTNISNDLIYNLNKSLEYINKLKTSDKGKLKALFFVDTINNAELVSKILNTKGIHSISVNSKNSSEFTVESIVNRLSNEDDKLNALVTINMFNEGVDILCVNTIIMLRKTNSEIIYTQQIGRGLRKSKNKTHLNVIDVVNNNEMELNRYVSLFGLEKDVDPLELVEKLLNFLNTKKNNEFIPNDYNHNEIFIEKISSENIVKMLSKKDLSLKLVNSFEKKIFDYILKEESLNLYEIETILNTSINLIVNNYKDGIKYKFEESIP